MPSPEADPALPQPSAPPLYKQFFIDKADERLDLFRKLAERYEIKSALYPGSFVHIAPSFLIPEVVYVDSDRRIPRFFSDDQLTDYIRSRAEYSEPPQIRFHHQSYEEDTGEPLDAFDLLISQYAGFISAACKQHLKPGGILLANDSHGDAAMANIDPDFQLIAVVKRRSDRFTLTESSLDEYMVTARPVQITPELLRKRGRGFAYTKPAWAYLFRRIA